MAQSIIPYKSLKEINSIVFHEIKFTGNIFLIDKDYDEEKKYTSEDILILSDSWHRLYDEYFEKTDDVKFRKELKNKNETVKLLLQIKLIDDLVELLEHLLEHRDYVPGEAYYKTISSIGNSLKKLNGKIRFDSTKDIKPQLEQIKAVKGGLQTRYELLFKEDLKVEKADIMLYYDIKAHIEQTLDRNLPEIINMLQWIAYEKQYKKRLSYGRKQHLRTKPSRGSS